MAKPSKRDYRYLLDGANELNKAIYENRVSDALRIGDGLFSRLSDDLKEGTHLRQALEDANHLLHESTRDAIADALKVFAERELSAFKKAGAEPVLIFEMQHDSEYAHLYVDLPHIDIKVVRKKIQDLRDSIRKADENIKESVKWKQIKKKSERVAYGGAVVYIDTAADLLGGAGLISAISLSIAMATIGGALGIPGLKFPRRPDDFES